MYILNFRYCLDIPFLLLRILLFPMRSTLYLGNKNRSYCYLPEELHPRKSRMLKKQLIRKKELFLENDRFYELKRNGRPEFWVAVNGQKYTNQKFMYNFPIPIRDTKLIPGLQQNEGYEDYIIN